MGEMLAYLNGEFLPHSECKLPIFDVGIVLGAAVTDFTRTFNGKLFRLEDHVDRLYKSCKYTQIKLNKTKQETIEISRKLVEENSKVMPGQEWGVVYYMTGGVNEVYAGGAGLPDDMESTYVQHTFPIPSHLWRDLFINGAHCVTPAHRHTPPQCMSSKIKHRNRLHMWIGDKEAHLADPKAVALYLDIHGFATETGGSNFLIYKDGKIISPKPPNILWGISLQTVTEILPGMGIEFVTADINAYDIKNADEAFLPTTPYCIGPVTKINGVPIGDGKPGPLWREILDRWSKMVGKDVYSEITGG
ncbi:MAG: hypothetical protein HN948_02100 [Clostridia bacterium]|jgi:branched-chain amino acid aminotransferase|nr:hypothetical protein [Clostridia bacterium]MBT7121782.1 hypothetical protein [Clostridia bacterium]